TIPAEDEKNSTDTPVQSKDTQSKSDTLQNTDTLGEPKPEPKEKSEGSGSGGGCSLIAEPAHYPYLNLKQTIEVNPLSAVMAAAVVARAVMMVRKTLQRKI
ncbi:hypothetical protein HZC21_05265, partial [Candidatus Peregrinibacteria bacterium]|nr:hypothetical protein [Candidatus Peregrinibacteria bacterium]